MIMHKITQIRSRPQFSLHGIIVVAVSVALIQFANLTAHAQTPPSTPPESNAEVIGDAGNPIIRLDDPILEQKARSVGQSLRCVICQNQSIEDSEASLAQDMRRLVRARLMEGDSEEEIIAYMQERYGDYVLLKPPVQTNTYVLWGLPFVLLLGAMVWFILRRPRRADMSEQPLTPEEQDELDRL